MLKSDDLPHFANQRASDNLAAPLNDSPRVSETPMIDSNDLRKSGKSNQSTNSSQKIR